MKEEKKQLMERIEQLEKELKQMNLRMNKLEEKIESQHLDPFNLLGPKKEAEPKARKKAEKKIVIPERPKEEPLSQEKVEPVAIAKREDAPPLAQPISEVKKEKESQSFEQILGTWLPRIFMTVLILGVLWGLKIGMDNGWISYEVRIALGYLATIGLYLFGRSNMKKNHPVFAVTLFGGLIAIGILVTMAAYYLYSLFNYPVAFTIGLIYIVFGLWISYQSRSEMLTIFSGFGGFLLPYLIIGSNPQTWTYCLYMLILFLSLFYMAIRLEHKASYVVTFFFFQISLLIYAIIEMQPGEEWYIVATAMIQHLLLLFFYTKGAITRHVFTESILYTNIVFMIGWIAILDGHTNTLVYGLFTILYVALAFYAFSKKDLNLQGIYSAIAVFIFSACILSFSTDSLESQIMLLLINGVVGLWVGLKFKTVRTVAIAGFIYVLSMLNVLMIMITSLISMEHVTWIVLLTSIVTIYWILYKYGLALWPIKLQSLQMGFIAGQLVALIYVYHLSEFILSNYIGLGSWELRDHLQMTIFLVAVIVSFIAYKWKHGLYIALAAVIEFLLLGLMISISPLATYESAGPFYVTLGIEILYFTLLTALFIAIWKNKLAILAKLSTNMQTLTFVMQLVYFYIFHKWYFAITNFYQFDQELVYLGHTIWMFLFAFVSISLGIRYSWNAIKIIGISLIGICLIKLFFIDLINISIIVRAALFIIVGIIGLIYSRLLIKNSEERDVE